MLDKKTSKEKSSKIKKEKAKDETLTTLENKQKTTTEYKQLESIINTKSIDYITDLIHQIKAISCYFRKININSQKTFCALDDEYKTYHQKIKHKLEKISKKLLFLTFNDKSKINIDSYSNIVHFTDDLLEMVSRNIDIISGKVSDKKDEDIQNELLKIRTEKLKNFSFNKKINLENDIFDIDNSYYPFIPKLDEKPNAIQKLDPEIIEAKKLRYENKEKLILKYEDSKNKKIQKFLYYNPYIPEISHFIETELEKLTNNEKEFADSTNEDIEFVEIESTEKKNNLINKNKKNKNLIFYIQNFLPENLTNAKFIDDEKEFDDFIQYIIKNNYTEIAIDLEHHSIESYLGITCLIQISTRDQDFIIDPIKLRSKINKLNIIFTNPNILKVFHGADYDILWLQRDFGVYVVNMFDTGIASRLLQYPSFSLKYLLNEKCDYEKDKKYQLADWRIRPLTKEMEKYAKNDTHFLLYIHDVLTKELIEKSLENDSKSNFLYLYKQCIKKSNELCMQSYQKPIVKDEKYYHYTKINSHKSKIEIGIIKETYIFRDYIARLEDRCPESILSKNMIFKLSKVKEFTVNNLLTVINLNTPFYKYLEEYILHINEKIKKVEEKNKLTLAEINKKQNEDYITKVKNILDKNKKRKESEQNNKNNFHIANEANLKKAEKEINKIKNNIKINEIETLESKFLTNDNNNENKNIINKNEIFNNFNLVEFLQKKHGISQIKINTNNNIKEEKSKNKKNEKNKLGNKKEVRYENELEEKGSKMRDLTNNDRVLQKFKQNTEEANREIISDNSEDDSSSLENSEEFGDRNKKNNAIKKQIREKELSLKKFMAQNKKSKYENEINHKFKHKKKK